MLEINKRRKPVFCLSCDGVPLKCDLKNGRRYSLSVRIEWAYSRPPATEWSDNTCKVRSKYVFKKGWIDQNHEDFIMLKQREVGFLCSANLEKKPLIYSVEAKNATLKF